MKLLLKSWLCGFLFVAAVILATSQQETSPTDKLFVPAMMIAEALHLNYLFFLLISTLFYGAIAFAILRFIQWRRHRSTVHIA
jgi:hypothetical protein